MLVMGTTLVHHRKGAKEAGHQGDEKGVSHLNEGQVVIQIGEEGIVIFHGVADGAESLVVNPRQVTVALFEVSTIALSLR